MIEVARTQDEEVGDGTTSVIILGKWFNVNNHQLSFTESDNFHMLLWVVYKELERWEKKEREKKIHISFESGLVALSQRSILNMVQLDRLYHIYEKGLKVKFLYDWLEFSIPCQTYMTYDLHAYFFTLVVLECLHMRCLLLY